MLEISNYLTQVGFNLKTQHDGSFHGTYSSDNGIEINTVFIGYIIGMEANFKGLKRIIIDSTEIKTVEELVFILTRNIFIKNHIQTLHLKMIQSQTL